MINTVIISLAVSAEKSLIMTKVKGFFESHLNKLSLCVAIVASIAAMYANVSASNVQSVKDKIDIETRLVRLETKVDLVLEKVGKLDNLFKK